MKHLFPIAVIAIPALLLLAGVRARTPRAIGSSSPLLPAPGRPAECRWLSPSASLQAQVDALPVSASACLRPGIYAGPLLIHHPVTLWGSRSAVIRTNGFGDTIDARSDQVRLLGFSVDGSGHRGDHNDAAVHLQGHHMEVRGLTIRHALFGIVVDLSDGVAITSNDIGGVPNLDFGLRGDAIRLWETHHAVISQNDVHDERDILVWYSGQVQVKHNRVVRGRYGTHFMFATDSEVEGNLYRDEIVGLFAMYSHQIGIRHNLFAGADTVNGMGIGTKESGNLNIAGNRFVTDTVGLYLDNTPLRYNESLQVNGNQFALCRNAVRFLSSPARTHFQDNAFQSNQTQVEVRGGDNALSSDWLRNYFDDYQGYDLNHDGTGDLPYRIESYSGALISEHPQIAFFRRTPALALVDTLGHLFPLFPPAVLLEDPSPRMRAPAPPQVGYEH